MKPKRVKMLPKTGRIFLLTKLSCLNLVTNLQIIASHPNKLHNTSLNPVPNAKVIHKSLKILIEKNVGDLGNRKRNGGHVGVSAKTMPMKSTLGSMPAHGEC
jgi:hypothetical protein